MWYGVRDHYRVKTAGHAAGCQQPNPSFRLNATVVSIDIRTSQQRICTSSEPNLGPSGLDFRLHKCPYILHLTSLYGKDPPYSRASLHSQRAHHKKSALFGWEWATRLPANRRAQPPSKHFAVEGRRLTLQATFTLTAGREESKCQMLLYSAEPRSQNRGSSLFAVSQTATW